MALLALTGLYAGSAGLTILKLPAVRSGTDLLKSGSSEHVNRIKMIKPQMCCSTSAA